MKGRGPRLGTRLEPSGLRWRREAVERAVVKEITIGTPHSPRRPGLDDDGQGERTPIRPQQDDGGSRDRDAWGASPGSAVQRGARGGCAHARAGWTGRRSVNPPDTPSARRIQRASSARGTSRSRTETPVSRTKQRTSSDSARAVRGAARDGRTARAHPGNQDDVESKCDAESARRGEQVESRPSAASHVGGNDVGGHEQRDTG